MQLILPLNKKDKESFRRSAIEIGFDEFVVQKFLYTVLESDVDVYQLMHDERVSLLIYGWEMCEIHLQNVRNTATTKPSNYILHRNVQTVIKWLASYSLDLWFSKEWDSCEYQMRKGLLYCIRRAEDILIKMPKLLMFSWSEILKWELHPWQQQYVSKFVKMSGKHKEPSEESIEEIEQPAGKQDIDYLREENVFIIVLRLIKMIDAFNLVGAKHLAMRVIAAWNAIFERARDIPGNSSPQIPKEFQHCVVCICHIYLLIVYEMDSNRGFVIDNMMNNIRFYYQSFLDKKFKKPFATIAVQLNFTPARFIALTCINLNISINNFFQMFTNPVAERNFSTRFGIISQSYISYILGNQLMEMNNMNEEHFNAQIERYKNIFNAYLEEREISEKFLADQLKRQEMQRNSHSMSPTIRNVTNIESKFCKGNRSYNIGNCDMGAEKESAQNPTTDRLDQCSDRKTDAMFEHMPNNEEILNYIYRILAKRSYDGWYFAKIVLLLKIIGHEVNVIETWRYHPGLTTDFMLGIETKLSKHYEDLAMIFHEQFFLEQEFWLTAFYLNPIRKYYTPILRCGMRLQRRLQHADEETGKSIKPEPSEKNGKCPKYGLLSSTIDVNEILKIRNHDMAHADYDELNKSLAALKLSSKTIKDLLTAIFLPRNKSFSWALNWPELRKRCRRLLKYPQLKRQLVELNMAEANDRLKYLNIDYDKYKNRPQLDYGTIEEGYETLMNFTEQEQEDDDSDDDVVEEVNETKMVLDHHDDLDDVKGEKRGVDTARLSLAEFPQASGIYGSGTRRTRARTAAAIATAILNEDRSRKTDTSKNEEQQELEKSSDSSVQTDHIMDNFGEELSRDVIKNVIKRNLEELLQERSVFNNETSGFGAFPDIWNFDNNILQTVDKKCAVLKENEKLYRRVLFLKKMNAKKNAHFAVKNMDIFDEATLSARELDICDEINTNNNFSQRIKWEMQKLKGVRTSVRQKATKMKEKIEVHKNNIASSSISIAPDIDNKIQNDGKHNCDASKDDATKTETMQASSKTFLRPKEENINTKAGTSTNFKALQHMSSLAFSLSENVYKGIENYLKLSTESLGGNDKGSFAESKSDSNLEVTHDNQVVDDKYGAQPPNETEKRSKNDISSSSLGELKSDYSKTNCGTPFVYAFSSDSKRTEMSCFAEKLKLFAGSLVNFCNSVEEFDILTNDDRAEKQSHESTIARSSTNDPFPTSRNNITNEVLEKTANDKGKFKLKEVVVRIKRLKVTDYTKLRQPRVRISRVGSIDSTLQSSEGKQRIDSKRSLMGSEDSSKSNKSTEVSSSSFTLRPYKKRKYRHNYSQSSEDSDDEGLINAQERKFETKMVNRQYSSTGRPIVRPRKLIATPRSASGLKMRISSAATFDTESVSTSVDFISSADLSSSHMENNIELIQISSSSSSVGIMMSSDDEIPPMTFVTPVLGNEYPIDDPLYEEEIILFDSSR